MHATDIDSLWFHDNPERQFRLRRQTPAEIRQWPVPPDATQTAWCVIRREDGALEAFGLAEGDTWDDADDELAPFFAKLRGDRP
ncbi:hypothetical protein ASG60_09450 [Methylobacterium sp. Leaf469]|uniref:hypothetical protein n=1 Tax=Methylobacterium sp. Leaf469 TaxID=1736387 RepID=UPI0006FCD420|nr:hypothetical protein [Methylobacterium sp. Leaf469]KQT89882.1 hypothetical protein ASG60_09450 [Methylobacterium sp. Leaf469]